MTPKVDPLQQLLLWRLAVAPGGGMFRRDITPVGAVKPAVRGPLVSAGYLREDRRSAGNRAKLMFLQLTENGWGWCQANLQTPITSPSRLAQHVLQRLLGILGDYFERQDHACSFGHLVQLAGSPPPAETLKARIRRACLELGGGREGVRVRIAQLRARLTGVAPRVLDEALLGMELARELSLLTLDDPREVTPADREGELRVPGGHPRHIIYFGGRGS